MMTIDDYAMEAAARTWKWWGPIERPWTPCPYAEHNLAEWFKKHWAAHPQASPLAAPAGDGEDRSLEAEKACAAPPSG